jgi:iron complex transport system substrate-binding protein
MQPKYILITALLIAAVTAFCGLGIAQMPAATGFPVNVTDDYGTTVTIVKAPERIVSLSPANTEILFDLGLGSKIVGDTEFCNYPAEAVNITHVSGFNTVSYEKIAAVNPDIIFAEDIVGEDAVKKLRSLGYNVIELKNSNLSSIRHSIEVMGRATGTSANATALINKIDAQVSNISARTAG